MIQVHNISDRSNTDCRPAAILIGGRKLRPGKSAQVDRSAIKQKHLRLHGTQLWFGALPSYFKATSQRALKAIARNTAQLAEPVDVSTLEGLREHLNGLKLSELSQMGQEMGIGIGRQLSKPALIARISRLVIKKQKEAAARAAAEAAASEAPEAAPASE